MQERKVATVTGGGQGIGKATAQRLLHGGYAVVIADVDEEAGRETAEEYRSLGDIRFVRGNVAEEASVRELIDETLRAHGRLDALVNNAGIGRFAPLAETTLADWNAVIGVNLTGAFLCAKHAAPHLAATHGAIVNIASTRALMSEPHTAAYSASKGGIVALTHSLAMSLGPAVRVNCICPGWIEVGDWKKKSVRKTPAHSAADRAQHPVGRVGVPDDVAAMVEYLLSPAAGFITGANFVVDGGMTRKMIYVE